MKKKGFTLIELLAVIVILAIIAIIATPIVLNIINDSKKSTTLRGVELYLTGVNNAIAKGQLHKTIVSDGTYSINDEGNLCLDQDCTKTLIVEIDGAKPKSGKVTVENGTAKTVTNLKLDGRTVSTVNGKLTIVEKETEEEEETALPGNYFKTTTNDDGTLTINGFSDYFYVKVLKNTKWKVFKTSQGKYISYETKEEAIAAGCTFDENGYITDTTCSYDFDTAETSQIKLVIPETIDGKTVTKVSGFSNLKLGYITLPRTITYLSVVAFSGATVEFVTYQGTVEEWNNITKQTSIGMTWNYGMDNLKKIICTDGEVTEI